MACELPGSGRCSSRRAPHCGQPSCPDLDLRSSCSSEPRINQPSPTQRASSHSQSLVERKAQGPARLFLSQNRVVPEASAQTPRGLVGTPGAPLAHSTCDPFSSALPQSSQYSERWDPPSARPTRPASKSCQTTNRPQSQLCGPGAAVGSLASVLACEEVPAPARKVAFLSRTELLQSRNGKQEGSPQRESPGPASQAPSSASPPCSPPGGYRSPTRPPWSTLGFGPDGQQRLRKGKTKHLPTNSAVGKEAL